jgi:Repeat of Unknown Function (DUF347)
MNLGYLVSTVIFGAIFIVTVIAQIRANRFHSPLYWTTIVATTTVGTTLADFADRSLGIGYAGGTSLLLAFLLASLLIWHRSLGPIFAHGGLTPRATKGDARPLWKPQLMVPAASSGEYLDSTSYFPH